MATIADIIRSVKENLGNRSSGLIGGSPVDTVVLAGVNKGFRAVMAHADPEYYNRMAWFPINTTAAEYVLPTYDEEVRPIKIKEITGANISKNGRFDFTPLEQIGMPEFLKLGRPSPADKSRPTTFVFFGEKIRFTCYPDALYTVTISVTTLPVDFTVMDLNKTLPFLTIWADVVEAYTTHYCFAKLQQTQDSIYWEELYQGLRREAKGMEQSMQFRKVPMAEGGMSTNPLLDPFVRRFNS